MKTDALTAILHLKKQMKFWSCFPYFLNGLGSVRYKSSARNAVTNFEFLDKWSSASHNVFKGTHNIVLFFSFFIPFGYDLLQEVPTSTTSGC